MVHSGRILKQSNWNCSHRDIKLIRDDAEGVKTSIHKAWEDIEENKSNLTSNGKRTAELSATCETLKDQLNAGKQRNLKLEQYSRRENIRLLFVKEDDEENTEEVFIKCLTEMGVYNPDMKFHSVHRVGRTRGKTRGGSY